MTDWKLTLVAEAEVTPPADASCVDVHPGEPCPGFPHEDEDAVA